ncbi:MAG: endoribonuclease MazF [Methylothermaceae bacterium]|nr:endoribonuclease MazF [Methylothermaceae bacterium]
MPDYIPKQGDIIWIDFDPQSGHEQAGRRPALVLSATAYNQKTGLMICCPITNQIKGYPFEVSMQGVRGTSGVALADQMKSFDWCTRRASKKGRAPTRILEDAIAKASALLKLD